MDTHELLLALSDAIASRPDLTGDRAWTEAIAEHFNRTCPADCTTWAIRFRDADRGEYLCDIVWARHGDGQWRSYGGLELAVETEWETSADEHCHDFAKLLDVRAHRRLFVGAHPSASWGAHDDRVALFHDMICSHRAWRADDEIGVLLWRNGGDFEHRCWAFAGRGLRIVVDHA